MQKPRLLGYFDSTKNAWIGFQRQGPLNKPPDSLFLYRIRYFDKQNQILKEDEYDQYGKITVKTIYKSDASAHSLKPLQFLRNIKPFRNFPKELRKDSVARALYYKELESYLDSQNLELLNIFLSSRELKKTDSASRSIETFYFDSRKNDSVASIHYITFYDQHWREIAEYDISNNGLKTLEEKKLGMKRILKVVYCQLKRPIREDQI